MNTQKNGLCRVFAITLLLLAACRTDMSHPTTLVPTPTASPEPTLMPTATPSGFAAVTHNSDWEPVYREYRSVKMALVPTGCFQMGSRAGLAGDERLVHEQCFDVPFWIDVTEVTNKQYGSAGLFAGDDLPRDSVNWYDATDHCATRGARLPTEAEWEYAARGPDRLIYPWGNKMVDEYAVYHKTSNGHTAPVGSIPENVSWVGAMDMAGNLMEWTSTLYAPYPYNAFDGREQAPDDSQGRGQRVLRGGSWFYQYRRENVRTDYRVEDSPERSDAAVGFRCVRDVVINEDP